MRSPASSAAAPALEANPTLLAADLDALPKRIVIVMVAVISAFALGAVLWAAFAPIDVAVSARGAVIPPSRVQELQSLEGGIVRRLLVQPGQRVRKGDLLVKLDAVQFSADLGESQQAMHAITATRLRIDALLANRTPDFGELVGSAPEIVREERHQWREARREYDATVAGAAEGVRRRAAERAEVVARIAALEPVLTSARASYQIEQNLTSAGAGARADLLAAQQRLLQQEAEVAGLRKSLPRLDAALAEARAQADEAAARLRSQWSAQRSELEGKAAALSKTVAGRADKVARRDLVSPMDGIVNRILIPTQGGVAQAGAPILEIVPIEDGVRIAARVRPTDIGFIHVGQDAAVRIAAYDSSIYGRLDAKVERVGADTLLDEQKQPYFEVQLKTQVDHLEHDGRVLPVTAGMSGDASILTGSRTVLQYLLKPVFKTFQSALKER